MPSRGIVLVTGANGFIGGWLAEGLYLEGEEEVRAGVRSWSSAARVARFPLNIVPCNILDPQQLDHAMNGATTVIHCAKGANIVRETQNVLEIALRHQVRRLVYVSSTEVYGGRDGEIDETSPCESGYSPYADSKIRAESLCWEYQGRGLSVTVVRPPIVYGPFSTNWTVNIARKLQSGNWGIFKGHGDGVCNLVYVGDVVDAIVRAARDERAAGEVFNVNGPDAPTWNQYFESFNQHLGLADLRVFESRKANLRAVLMEPLRMSAKLARDRLEKPMKNVASRSGIARHVMKAFEQTMKTTPHPADLRLYGRQALYLATKMQNILDFTPKTDVETGLDMSVRWLKQVGLAPQNPR